MTNGTTNPLLTKTESTAAASFFSVLSSTVGLPAPVVAANDSRSGEPDDSNAASPQQDQPTKTSQANPGAQQQNITLPSPFSDVAGTNLTVLPAARFRAFLSTTSATVPSTISARQNQKDSAEPAPVLKNTSAVTVPTTPVPADVVATPAKEEATMLAASVSGVAATAVEAKPATSAADAIEAAAHLVDNID
jgi:hypothetical protein